MKFTIQERRTESVSCMCDEITYGIHREWCDVTWKPLNLSLLRERHFFDYDPHRITPVIIWICGGAFTHVDKNVWMPELAYFAKKGFAVASIEYDADARMRFPDPILQIKQAIRFLRAKAQEFQLDPDRMVIMGESAGAYLANFVALTNDNRSFEKGEYLEYSSSVKAAVSLYTCAKEIHMEGDRIVMPDLTEYVTETAPPFMLFHGTKDEVVSCKESEYFYDALVNRGIQADLYMIEGAKHADSPFYQSEIKDQIIDFMKQVLDL